MSSPPRGNTEPDLLAPTNNGGSTEPSEIASIESSA